MIPIPARDAVNRIITTVKQIGWAKNADQLIADGDFGPMLTEALRQHNTSGLLRASAQHRLLLMEIALTCALRGNGNNPQAIDAHEGMWSGAVVVWLEQLKRAAYQEKSLE